MPPTDPVSADRTAPGGEPHAGRGLADGRPLVIASNRGPVSHDLDPTGEPIQRRGVGGLVTALTGSLDATGGLWVASAMTEGDRIAAEASTDGHIEVLTEDAKYSVRYLTIDPATFANFYDVISNRVLWFVHHFLFDVAYTPRFDRDTQRAWEDYVEVNRAFADALAAEGTGLGRPPAYLVQDYHLSLVPGLLRERLPDALIAHFSHTPFAGPSYFSILPRAMTEAILRGLLAADILGFHSQTWAQNFLLACRELPGASVDLRRSRVELEGRRTYVRIHPIGIDAESLRASASAPEVRAARRELLRWRGDAKLVLRVDRTELTKNIVRGFLAFEAFLREHPSWLGRVRFLALLNPSRIDLPEYRDYTQECLRTAERINGELAWEGPPPIEVAVQDDFPRAVAAYGLYDVLMVNPVFDGMNLVAMEGPVVNRNAGAVILSRNAGAFSLLGRHTIGVNPFDVGETARALHTALSMPEEERSRRARALRAVVRRNTPARWVSRQLDDLDRAAARR
ncbi:MAG: trehalose-6-phosphate synthase [Actinomycetota bacterium]|nr:trehalose-6-phosphate synthase [Actinomycetota bacterium]